MRLSTTRERNSCSTTVWGRLLYLTCIQFQSDVMTVLFILFARTFKIVWKSIFSGGIAKFY